MKLSIASLAMFTAAALPLAAHSAGGQDAAKPIFTTLPNDHAHLPALPPGKKSKNIVQWNGSFTDLKGNHVTYTMIGTDPNSTNTTTHIKTIIIPIKMVYGKTNGNMTFDPLTHIVPNGVNVIQSIQQSPLLDNGIDFVQGGKDLGQTQYIDAYQRGNFWSTVSSEPNYHVLLDATVAPEQTIKVGVTQGLVVSNPFGATKVGEMDINAFDSKLQSFIANKTLKIKPNTFPLFITYNIFLTEFAQCCIGGYHSANGSQPSGQSYGYSTYVDDPGSFSQDVSAISHEIGEWLDDPFVDNNVNCTDNSLMENGDPLENNPNYGAFPYKLNSFTYNLQSLVFIDYFGAPASGPVNGWLSFQNDKKTVCPGQ